MAPPTNPREVRSYLGFAGYYRRFVPHFSIIASPLHVLTRQDVQFQWTEECQQAFMQLKQALIQAPV